MGLGGWLLEAQPALDLVARTFVGHWSLLGPAPSWLWLVILACVLGCCCFCAGCGFGLAAGECLRSDWLWRLAGRALRALLRVGAQANAARPPVA